MFKNFTLLFLITVLLLFCNEQKTEEIRLDFKPFVPPLNDSITPTQASLWLKCNPPLDSLSKLYTDSFATEDPSLRLKYQKDFKNRQDTICVQNGLKGGFSEYKWIMENAGKSKNSHLFNSLKSISKDP